MKKSSTTRKINKSVSAYINRIKRPNGRFSEVAVNETFIADLAKEENYQVSIHDKEEAITGTDYLIGLGESVVFKAQAKIVFVRDKHSLIATLPKLKLNNVKDHYEELINGLKKDLHPRDYFLTLSYLESQKLNQAELQILDCIFSNYKYYPIFIFYCSPDVKTKFPHFLKEEHTLQFACSYDVAKADIGSSESITIATNLKRGKNLAKIMYSGISHKTFWEEVINQKGALFLGDEKEKIHILLKKLKDNSNVKNQDYLDRLKDKLKKIKIEDLYLGINTVSKNKSLRYMFILDPLLSLRSKERGERIFTEWKENFLSLVEKKVKSYQYSEFISANNLPEETNILKIKI